MRQMPEWTLARMQQMPEWTLARMQQIPEWTLARTRQMPELYFNCRMIVRSESGTQRNMGLTLEPLPSRHFLIYLRCIPLESLMSR